MPRLIGIFFMREFYLKTTFSQFFFKISVYLKIDLNNPGY
jgi:hypothetical protein